MQSSALEQSEIRAQHKFTEGSRSRSPGAVGLAVQALRSRAARCGNRWRWSKERLIWKTRLDAASVSSARRIDGVRSLEG
jgi:hypothetical protein